jgi:hypothetical protein
LVRNKIELNFGNPEHGWLPVEFKYAEFELNFDASDVPKIPTDLLCECLVSILKGLETKMYWFLEPGHYLFEFVPNGKVIDLLISASNASIAKHKGMYKITGSYDSIILPMYRTLKKFNTIEFNELDWEKIDRVKLDELTELINKRKTAYNNGYK